MSQGTKCNFCAKAFAALPSFWFRNIVLSALNCFILVGFSWLIATSLSSLFIHIIFIFHTPFFFFSKSLQDSHCSGISPAFFFFSHRTKILWLHKNSGLSISKNHGRGGRQSLATATITASAADVLQTTLNSLPMWAASVFALCVYRNLTTKLW